MEPLGWDEIVSQPGMGGYLSFLNGPIPLPHLQPPAAEVPTTPVVVSDPRCSLPEASDRLIHSLQLVASAVVSVQFLRSTFDTSRPWGHIKPAVLPVPDVPLPRISSSDGPYTPPRPSVSEPIRPQSSASDIPYTASAVTPGPDPIPRSYRAPGVISTPGTASAPALSPVSGDAATTGRRPRIRKCAAAHDGHSLGEEVLYQALWQAATAESAGTRTIVIGWRGMSQLCRMTPKNCKINTQRLLRKLALEILSPYNTPESIGTTYRIFPSEAIVRRRRVAGLEWVVRSRGVEFVDPATGIALPAHLCGYVSEDTAPL